MSLELYCQSQILGAHGGYNGHMQRNSYFSRGVSILLGLALVIVTPVIAMGYLNLRQAEAASDPARAAELYKSAAGRLFWRADLWERAGLSALEAGQPEEALLSLERAPHLSAQGWQARALLSGQYTGNALVSGEQFGLGGADSVRGYMLREVVNDRGYAGQLEVYTPELASRFGLSDKYKLRLLAFYDFGAVQRNHALPGEELGDSVGSVGFGARVGYGKSLSMRLDRASILEPTANRARGSLRLGMAAAIMF